MRWRVDWMRNENGERRRFGAVACYRMRPVALCGGRVLDTWLILPVVICLS